MRSTAGSRRVEPGAASPATPCGHVTVSDTSHGSRRHRRSHVAHEPLEQVGELLDARPARERGRATRRESGGRRRARPAASGRAAPSARARSRRRRRARRRRPRPSRASSRAAAPSGGTSARIGRSAARYSNTFPESTPRPRPSASGISSSSASESRCSSSERRRGTYGISSSRSPMPGPPPTRGRRERKSPTKRATTPSTRASARQERPRVALAEERAGVRDPERASAARRYSSPAKSSKSEPFAIVDDRPVRLERAHLLGDRVGDGDDRVGLRARRAARPACSPCSFARTASRSRVAVRVRDERVAQVGDPARARRLLAPRRRRGAPTPAARS